MLTFLDSKRNPALKRKKFKNVNLFSRRERIFSANRNGPFKKFSHLNSEKKLGFQNYNYSTTSTNPSTRIQTSKTRQKNTLSNLLENLDTNFYLTETNLTEIIIDNPKIINRPSTAATFTVNKNKKEITIQSPENDIEILQKIGEHTKKLDSDDLLKNKDNNLIGKKIHQINRKKEGINEFINKTRDVLLFRYQLKQRKERVQSLSEAYTNQIENIDDQMKKLKKAKELFIDEFFHRITEYNKFLKNQLKKEKIINNELYDITFKLKKEILDINNNILKIEFEKNNVLKWIYFQILLKEKRLTIPNHYKIIIEEPKTTYDILYRNPNFNPDGNDTQNYSNQPKKRESKPVLYRRLKTRRIFGTNFRNLSNLFKTMKFEDIQNIRNYKLNCIYQTAEEFYLALNKLENENIFLISEFNYIQKELLSLKNQRQEEKNIYIQNMKDEEIKFEKKTIELENLKKKHNLLLNQIKQIKNEKIKIKRPKTATSKLYSHTASNYSKTKGNLSKTQLYSRVVCLYQIIQKLDLNNIFDEVLLNNKKKLILETKGDEMIHMLHLSELAVNSLLNTIKFWKYNSNKEIVDKFYEISYNMEKIHKIEKNKLQIEAHENRIKEINKKIFERNNKIYCLPKRKIDQYYERFFVKKKNYENKKQIKTEPTFEDYMYDVIKHSDDEI